MTPNLKILTLLVLSYNTFTVQGASIHQTQTQLSLLENKIVHLQKTLNSDQSEQNHLNKALAETEKKISDSVYQSQSIQLNLHKTKDKVNLLEQQVATLNLQLNHEQQLLAQHVRTRYKMGPFPPLKWLLNPDSAYKKNHIIMLYQYLLRSRLQAIEHIKITKKEYDLANNTLHQELDKQEALQRTFTHYQKNLQQDKQQQVHLIHAQNNTIQSKQQILLEYQKNKKNLAHLLRVLTQRARSQTQYAFSSMRSKLPYPVLAQHTLRDRTPGLVFLAKEGTRVNAVYPGKVLFSNWLNGYGLLLIIDHGQGFMTLYAHNQSLFKRQGDTVKQGEQIATVGHSGGLKKNGLYFEIRHRGKTLSPREWLS